MVKLSEDRDLTRAMKRVRAANKVRLVFIFIALLAMVYIFFGDKFAAETSWYPASGSVAYFILFFAVVGMFLASLFKTVLAVAYNKLLRMKKEQNASEIDQ